MLRWSMGSVLSALVLGCAETSLPLCPAEWEPDEDEGCVATPEAADLVDGSSGVFGFVKSRTCACGPGDSGDVEEELVVQAVMVFDAGPFTLCGTLDSWHEGEPPLPLVTQVVSDEGIYAVSLEPGRYCIAAWDYEQGDLEVRQVQIGDDERVEASFVFEQIYQ